jgi:hypothetical protein
MDSRAKPFPLPLSVAVACYYFAAVECPKPEQISKGSLKLWII